MALLYITEFSDLPLTDTGIPDFAMTPPVVDQTPVTVSGTSATSAAFNAITRFVRLESDVVCSVAFGANPTATTSNARLAANGAGEYFGVVAGAKVAVIANS